eukprot:Skav208023  [mRNA]  locus=scaffold2714:347645:349180:- [translate_table: standard]
MAPRVAQRVGKLAITKPDVLRVTRACQAFQNCAEAFRSEDKDFYHKSRKSANISMFWSHSWHGSSWAKVLTLLELYNGWPSILLGTSAATVAMGLFGLGLLPGFSRTVPGEAILWSTWSTATGLVVTVTCFILWKPQQEVFFDRVCISEDPELKAHAILSLAGMLKNSKEMLVLWDPSWSDRLWCLFELAAFLKCRKTEGNKKVLIVRPTFVGPCSIAAFLAVSAAMLGLTTLPMPLGFGFAFLIPIVGLMVFGGVVGVFAVATFRAYFYSVQILEEKLRSKTFDTVKSSCCEMDHMNAHGRPILCDRHVVEQCWFGSIEAFEESFRSELSGVVTEELCQNVFTQGWILKVSMPILWALMDFIATNINIGYWAIATEWSLLCLVACVLCAPMFGEFGIFLTKRYCGRAACCGGGIFSDVLLNLALALTLGAVAALMGGLLLATYSAFHSSPALIRGFAVFGAFCSLYIITYAVKKGVYLMTRKRKPMERSMSNATNCQAGNEVIGRTRLSL